jgi:hypothetical protein
VNWEEILSAFGEAISERDHNIRVPVQSRAIEEIEYNTEDETMSVTFTNGSQYDYPSIRRDQFMEFVNAPSKGSFYNSYVRGQWG